MITASRIGQASVLSAFQVRNLNLLMLLLGSASQPLHQASKELRCTLSDSDSSTLLLLTCRGWCRRLWDRICLDEPSMFVHLIVHIVHADNARDVVLMCTRRHRIFRLLGSSQDTSRGRPVVFVGLRVPPQVLWNEPARTVRLLPLDHKKLEGHEQDDACR